MKRIFYVPFMPHWSAKCRDQFQKQLHALAQLPAFLLILNSVAFPASENVLYSLASANNQQKPTLLWWIFGATIAIHAVLIVAQLKIATPLPQLLLDFSSISEKNETHQNTSDTYKCNMVTFQQAIIASQFSLATLQSDETDGLSSKDSLKALLDFWVQRRSEIFWFHEGDALYSFSIYLMKDNALHMECRSHDDRLVTNDRTWASGDGFIGQCHMQRQTLFYSMPETQTCLDHLNSTQAIPTDQEQYKSMGATPIIVEGKIVGVFIVTSSKAGQFKEHIHTPIIEMIGLIFAQDIASHHGRLSI